MSKIRVLVVDDSLTVRRHLCDILAADPEIEVVAEAQDGREAIERCRELRPDVVTLDMWLPVMSGLTATEYIMAHFPTPVLIVSAATNRGELFQTYDALAAGAVEVLEKPTGDEDEGVWEEKLVSTVKLVSRIKVITHPRARLGSLGRTPSAAPLNPPVRSQVPPAPAAPLSGASDRRAISAIALGASTGGPSALANVLRAIPAGLPLPILVVLHIDDPFGVAFVEWLDDQTPHNVVTATDGEPISLAHRRVTVAPPNRHMVVSNGRIQLTSTPERHSCRPSVDELFESLARECGASTIAALLTGMGQDGAAGLLAIRQSGGSTFAQDEATSVVYGMPREAALLGAAERVLPLDEIGPSIARLLTPSRP